MIHIDITGHALPGDQPDTCYRVISLTHHTQAGILLIFLFPFLYLRKVLSCISLLIGYHVLVCSCVTYEQYVLAFQDNPKRRLKGFLYLER